MDEAAIRVKVYFFSEDSDWISPGCGYVSCTSKQIKEENILYITVINETDGV
jgi:hypothetical protein